MNYCAICEKIRKKGYRRMRNGYSIFLCESCCIVWSNQKIKRLQKEIREQSKNNEKLRLKIMAMIRKYENEMNKWGERGIWEKESKYGGKIDVLNKLIKLLKKGR